MIERDKYTIQEAATLLGISRQAVYKRIDKMTSDGLQVDVSVNSKIRYISREALEAMTTGTVNQQTTQLETIDRLTRELSASNVRISALVDDLRDAKGKAAVLEASTTAQAAQIDDLRRNVATLTAALDREQALHMTALQRLPAPRSAFWSWISSKKSK